MLNVKVIVIGNVGTGKTSCIRRLAFDCYSANYKATIGVDFVEKSVQFNNTQSLVNFWDISGQDQYCLLARSYYRDANGCFVVIDISQQNWFEDAQNWITQEQFQSEEVQMKLNQLNATKFYLTSAYNGVNLEESLMDMLVDISKNGIKKDEDLNGKILIQGEGNKNDKKKCCQ